jgi:HAD superfamily hydrolase (TIGR01509 family)
MRYQGFIFDLDGTLVDSALDFPALHAELGLPLDQPILEAVAQWEPKKQVWAHEIIHRHELRGAEVSVMIPGVAEFLSDIHRRGLPRAIFTRNSKRVALATVAKHGLDFSVVISRDDAPPKPLPDGLHVIRREFQLPVEKILYVGDYLFDLQAGRAAQMPTALYLPNEPDFSTHGASFQFTHYEELRAHCLG